MTPDQAKEVWQHMHDIIASVTIRLDKCIQPHISSEPTKQPSLSSELKIQDPTSQAKARNEKEELSIVLPIRWWQYLTKNNKPENLLNPTSGELSVAFHLFMTLIHVASQLVRSMYIGCI